METPAHPDPPTPRPRVPRFQRAVSTPDAGEVMSTPAHPPAPRPRVPSLQRAVSTSDTGEVMSTPAHPLAQRPRVPRLPRAVSTPDTGEVMSTPAHPPAPRPRVPRLQRAVSTPDTGEVMSTPAPTPRQRVSRLQRAVATPDTGEVMSTPAHPPTPRPRVRRLPRAVSTPDTGEVMSTPAHPSTPHPSLISVPRLQRVRFADMAITRFTVAEQLQDFMLKGVRPNGRCLGSGAYGIVEELEVNGVLCAGKNVHHILLDPLNQGVDSMQQRFVQECRSMSRLRHPHIVQFLGVWQKATHNLPVLVMEYLPITLDTLLAQYPDIPITMKISFLHDVAKGLTYLHECDPPVIHRNLTARNVLLNHAMVAKIADFGVSRIVNLSQDEVSRMTQAPSNICYMPPEAIGTNIVYTKKLDIFSFGVLALFTVTQQFPGNLLPATYADDSGRTIGRTEIERRERYFIHATEVLQVEGHPEHRLLKLIYQCLQFEVHRPTVLVLLPELEAMRRELDESNPYAKMHKLDMILMLRLKQNITEQQRAEILRLREAESGSKNQISELRAAIEYKDMLIARLEQRSDGAGIAQSEKTLLWKSHAMLQQLQEVNAQLQGETQGKEERMRFTESILAISEDTHLLLTRVQELERSLALARQQQDSKMEELEGINSELDRKSGELRIKEDEVLARQVVVEHLRLMREVEELEGISSELERKSGELRIKEDEVLTLQLREMEELEGINSELDRKSGELRIKEDEVLALQLREVEDHLTSELRVKQNDIEQQRAEIQRMREGEAGSSNHTKQQETKHRQDLELLEALQSQIQHLQAQYIPLDMACAGGQHGIVELLLVKVCQNRRLAQREAAVLLSHLPCILQVLPTELLLDRSLIADEVIQKASSYKEGYFANAIVLSRILSGLPQLFQMFVDVVQKSHPYFANILEGDLQALSAAPLLPVGVYGTSTVLTASVSSAAHILSWLEYGIMIEIPRDAVTSEGSITVQLCLSGPFILPEDHKLVSPVFIISTTAKFTKPIALSLAHHSKLFTEEDCEEMSFVFSSMRTHLQRDQPMYPLEPVAGGRFRPHSLVGTISLHHFCGGAIARKRKRSGQSGSPPTKKAKEVNHCIVCLHSPEQFLEDGQAHAVFSVTQDPLQFQTVSDHVGEWFPNEHLLPNPVALEFSNDAVELDIPHSFVAAQGYQIIPGRNPCKIRQVDMQPGMCTPTVILRIRGVSFSQGILQCDLDVKGTAETCTFPLLVTHPASRKEALAFIFANLTTILERLQEAKETTHSLQVIPQEMQEETDNLTLSDLKTILEELCQVAYKWKSIGTQLCLEEGVLKNIQYSCPLDPKAALQEIVSEWLKRVSPPPTWKALVEALRSKSVGEERLALSIEQKYCPPTAGLVMVAQAVVPESSVAAQPYQLQPQQKPKPTQPSPKLVPPCTSSQTTLPKMRCSLDEVDRNVIPKIAHKWFQLGRYLRLDRELLHGIQSDNSDDIAKCRDMFTEWLVRPELQPSWEKLIEAMKSDVVSEIELAAELSEKYLQ